MSLMLRLGKSCTMPAYFRQMRRFDELPELTRRAPQHIQARSGKNNDQRNP